MVVVITMHPELGRVTHMYKILKKETQTLISPISMHKASRSKRATHKYALLILISCLPFILYNFSLANCLLRLSQPYDTCFAYL